MAALKVVPIKKAFNPTQWMMKATRTQCFRQSVSLLSWIAPERTLKGLEKALFTPLPLPLKTKDKDFLDQADQSNTLMLANGKTIRLWTYGDQGPHLVFVHGWGGRGVQFKAFAEAAIRRGFRVTLFDLPAHGQSSGKTTNLVEAYQAIERVVDDLQDIQGFVAHSFGAAATSYFLRRSKIGVPSAFISPLGEFTPGLRDIAFRHGMEKKLFELVKDRIEVRIGVSWDEELCPVQTALEQTSPLLLVHDKDDIDLPSIHSERLQLKWPGSRLLLTDGLGHFRILRNDDVIESVLEFIQSTQEDS